MQSLTVEILHEGDIARVFPLVQLLRKDLSLDEWMSHARNILDGPTRRAQGILAARDPHDVILGLLQYEIRMRLDGIRYMVGTSILTYGLFHKHRQQVAINLIGALEALARERRCQFLQTEVTDRGGVDRHDGLGFLLETSGHEPASRTFYKTL
jgi:hypothetical protein